MATTVDEEIAEETLLKAFKNKKKEDDKIALKIRRIINGTHLTYRYILVNALLAKASNTDVNPLCLQAGASCDGAFDARSLCHKVLVPFEREYLSNALGGSNEPFLNKPARFSMLSSDNAVRAGKDFNTLQLLIETLSSITTGEIANKYLQGAMQDLDELAKYNDSLYDVDIENNSKLSDIYNFILELTTKKCNGEICALIVGTLETLYYNNDNNYSIKSHKVNQSGSSSKEVGDIDIFYNNKVISAIEVKDKDFSDTDVEHALKKFFDGKCEKSMFIFGCSVHFDEDAVKKVLLEYDNKGLFTIFTPILPYCRNILYRISTLDRKTFISTLFKIEKEIQAKEETINWVRETITKLGWES